MRSRGRGLASPTVIGSVTTLIVIVVVFLAYNANNGLPFVPVYRVSVEVPNAARMLPSNEVRIGGRRVGVVESLEPIPSSDEAVTSANGESTAALLNLKLDLEAKPLPEDSTFRIRYRSAFGLKYLEVTRGTGSPAPEGFVFRDTDTLHTDPAPDTPEVVAQTEEDEISNTFKPATREHARTTLTGFGDAFSGRGVALNRVIQGSRELFSHLTPVARVLAAPGTELGRLIEELGDTARIFASVAEQQAELFGWAADVFGAISPESLAETISEGVPTLETALDVLPGQRRLLAKVAALSGNLLPGAQALETALPPLNDAAEVGTPVLARTPAVAVKLERSLAELETLVDQPSTLVSLLRLTDFFDSALPLAAHVVPAQTVCNYFNYFFGFVPATIAEEDQVGFTARQRALVVPTGPIHVGAGPAEVTLPGEAEASVGGYSGLRANGIAGVAPDPAAEGVFKPYEIPILHYNAYGPSGQSDADCQAGQAGYVLGQRLVPGQPVSDPTAFYADIPGSLGPTTVFFNRNGKRVLHDTRVPSRQP